MHSAVSLCIISILSDNFSILLFLTFSPSPTKVKPESGFHLEPKSYNKQINNGKETPNVPLKVQLMPSFFLSFFLLCKSHAKSKFSVKWGNLGDASFRTSWIVGKQQDLISCTLCRDQKPNIFMKGERTENMLIRVTKIDQWNRGLVFLSAPFKIKH